MTGKDVSNPTGVSAKTAAPIRWVVIVNIVCYVTVALTFLAALTVALMATTGVAGIWGAAAIAVPFGVASLPGAVLTSLALLRLASGPEDQARRRGAIGGAIVSASSMAATVALLVALIRPEPPPDLGLLVAILAALSAVTGFGAGSVAVRLRRAYWLAPT